MYVYEQKSYQKLEEAVDRQLTINGNMVIVTVPGLGITFCLKSYLDKKKNKSVAFITGEGQELNKFNILDLDFHNNDRAGEIVDAYFKVALPNQKFIVVLNSPSLLGINCYFLSHIYSYYYFAVEDKEGDTDKLALGNNKELSGEELQLIYKYSGGIGQIAKYLAINSEVLKLSAVDLVKISTINNLISPIAVEILKCDKETLTNLNLWVDNTYRSGLVNEYLSQNKVSPTYDIVIDFDLTLVEAGEPSKEKVTKTEKDILEKMLKNGGRISKELVSDIKWGEGKYDEYSDQAINKTMRRLGQKLEKHIIETIPKVGFSLLIKNGK